MAYDTEVATKAQSFELEELFSRIHEQQMRVAELGQRAYLIAEKLKPEQVIGDKCESNPKRDGFTGKIEDLVDNFIAANNRLEAAIHRIYTIIGS